MALSPARIATRLPRVGDRKATARRRRGAQLRLLLDVSLLGLAVGASRLGAARVDAPVEPWGWTLAFVVLSVALIAARGGYRFRLEVSPFEYVGQILAATALAAILVTAGRVLLDPGPNVAAETIRLWGFSAVYLAGARVALALANRRANREGLNTLIVGAGSIGQLVARRLLERPEMGLRPVGFLDKEPRAGEDASAGIPVLGASWHLEEVAARENVDHVIVTFSTAPHAVLLNIVRRCRALGLEVSLVPRLFEEISNRVSVEHLGGIALLRVDRADPRGWQFEVKYATDRLVGATAVVLLSPVLLGLAALVKLTSPGPVFFRQPRVGLDGREFDILKFRTMRIGGPASGENDAAWAAAVLGDASDGGSAQEDDSTEDRRTPIGRFLRRWSLDELPQLINVARGDMSLIGPRPERTGYVRAFEQHVYRYGDRHRVKSGLTGWAQVHGLRGETSLEDRVEWDNYYVENWSPWLDLKILFLTVPAVLSGRGAA